jgi:hypothetical protein
MTKVKVLTIGAVINGHPIGSKIELEERTAKRLAAQSYVQIIDEPAPVKKESAPKKPAAKAKSKSKKKDG